MGQAQITSLSAAELHTRLSEPESAIAIHRDAIEKGVGFGRYLEALNPTERGDDLDAYERQLREAGIVTRSDPAAGYWASEAKVFFDNPAGRALYPEFFARQYRKVMFGNRGTRDLVLSDDSAVGSWDRPYADTAMERWQDRIEATIPLSEIVAFYTPVTGSDYRAAYIDFDADEVRKYRVTEGADIPLGKLLTSEQTIRLHKYGRGIQMSYEAQRRLRIDRLAWWIQFAALQDEIDKVSAAIDVLINGDGNGNAAINSVLNTHDSAAQSGTLTLKGFLSWEMDFSPYVMTTMLMRKATALQVRLLNVGSANVPLAGSNLGGAPLSLRPINRTAQNIGYGWTNDVPANVILGFDRRFGIEMVTEIGSVITETQRFITNQTNVMVMTEVSGFAKIDKASARTLTLTWGGS